MLDGNGPMGFGSCGAYFGLAKAAKVKLRDEVNNNLPILLCLLVQYCVKKPRRCAASPTFFALSWAKSLRKIG